MNNVEILQNAYRAFARGDIPTVLDAMDQNIEWDVPKQVGGRVQGKDKVGAFFQNLQERYFQELRVEPQNFLADGDYVIALGRHRAITKDAKKNVELPFAHVWKLRNGKIVSMNEYTDTAALQDALIPARTKVSA